MRIEKIIDILYSYFNIEADNKAMINYMNCAQEILDVCDKDNKMLTCEGYKMFQGTMSIMPKNSSFEPFEVDGTWLYKPDTKCWYCNGWSYIEDICIVKDAIEI